MRIPRLVPGRFGGAAAMELASVNLPVAVLILAMVWPMLAGVDFFAPADVGERPQGTVDHARRQLVDQTLFDALPRALIFDRVFAGPISSQDARACLAG